ncbi:MAG TPA: hypothetical protein VF806_10110 [Anaerolineaceae bacterium]
MVCKNHLVMPFAAFALLVCVVAFRGSTGFAQGNQPNQGVVVNPGANEMPGPAQAVAVVTPPVLGSAVISFGPEAFQPWDRSVTLSRDGTLMLRPLTPAGADVALDAPLILPQGVEIKQIVAYLVDYDATYNVVLDFIVHQHAYSSGFSLDFVNSSSLPQSGNVQYISMSSTLSNNRYIDNTSNSYIIRVELYGGANTWLNSVRVDYSYPTALPAIMKK